jgi:CheY-like chemotaxis protein/anti-sigma regulatory factor (Ser/Thr protein kinase)
LEASNADLVQQRDAVNAAREALATRALELRRANRYKSEFLASMSHELRTPLNSCLILSRALADNKPGNLSKEQVKFAETIYSSGTDLLELINTVLDLSKIEAGAIELVTERVTLADVVNPVYRVMEPIAAERKLQLQIHSSDPEALIETDVLRVQQILKNLLSNACKFTLAGSVTLHVQASDSHVTFRVEDTGIGIPEEQLESIFEAFRQADGTASRRFGGTGLGLTISRDLAKRLGGDVEVTSNVGVGSAFVLVIPRYAAGTGGAQPPRLHSDTSEGAKVVSRSESARQVLLVQRKSESREDVDRTIESWDFEVTRVSSNAEAAILVGTRRLAAVVGQPGEGIAELKEEAARVGVPFHVMSDNAGQQELTPGISRHLRKPADEDELRRALKALFERKRPSDGVLLVEDDEISRKALELVLEENDVKVTSTATRDGALKALQSSTFACVILDLQLADGRGEDLLRTISNSDAYSLPHVIVYTGEVMTSEQEQELLRFSDAVILKGARSEERLLDEVSLFLYDVNEQSQRIPKQPERPSTRPKGGAGSLRNRRVLLVEDDVRNVYALTSVLEREGVRVEVARNGKEALAKLEAAPCIDLVLMDIMMPEMNGFEAMQAIRSSAGGWHSIPIIALTAKAMSDDRKACLDAGANDYVTKPIDVDKLLSLMRIWLDRT